MPGPQLQLAIGWLKLELTQSKSGYGRSVLCVEVRFVGLVARIRLASDTAWWQTDGQRGFQILPLANARFTGK